MHCVVFGATGYLGTRLVPPLLDDVAWRGRGRR